MYMYSSKQDLRAFFMYAYPLQSTCVGVNLNGTYVELDWS
jgi:hypothetical protein